MYPKQLDLFLSKHISKSTNDGRVLRDLVFQGHVDRMIVARMIAEKQPELRKEFSDIVRENSLPAWVNDNGSMEDFL